MDGLMEATTASKGPKDEVVLAELLKRFDAAAEAEAENRGTAKEDQEFLLPENQWGEIAKKRRKNRPSLALDHLNQHVRQVINDIRQNRPAIKVQGVDDKADPETAQVLSGLIRHIEYNSNADVAYDTAAESAVRGGWGFFRVVTDYAGDEGDEQEIFIRRIVNPFTVYFDPDCMEPDYSDARWAFVTEEISKAEFESRYPKAQPLDFQSAKGDSKLLRWVGEDNVRIGEYWCVKQEGRKRRVCWYKTNGVEILERGEWAGRWIPIVPVLGEEIYVEGKRYLRSLIHNAKDAQRLYNFWKSTEAELLQKSPKTPFVGAVGQFKTKANQWATANIEDWPYLEYDPISTGGQPAPPPQRQPYPGPPTGIIQAAMGAADDIKSILGMYDASLGQRSNETSGKAILARQREGDNATFHFTDNLSRAIRHAGRILVDLIPKIYDTARVVRILGEDGAEKIVGLNGAVVGKQQGIYDLGAGRYDVVVSAGPSYATKRQEAAESMMAFVQAVPQAGQAAADLIAKNMDWPGAEEISERLKKMLPPGLAEPEEGEEGQPQPPPEMVAQMQAMQQQMGELQQAADQNMAKLHTEQLKADTDIQIAQMKIAADIEIANINARAKVAPDSIQTIAQELMALQQTVAALTEPQGYGEPAPAPMPYMGTAEPLPEMAMAGPEASPQESFGELQ